MELAMNPQTFPRTGLRVLSATILVGTVLALAPAAQAGAVCHADFNQDGTVNSYDIFDFLRGWFAGLPSADIDFNGRIEVQDVFAFISIWFTGC
jgi:hypothetical protein